MRLYVIASLLFFSFTSFGQVRQISIQHQENTEIDKSHQQYYHLEINREDFKPSYQKSIAHGMISLELDLGDHHYKLDLFEDDLVAPELIVELEQKNLSSPITYEGYTQSGSRTRITINDNFIYGYIEDGDHTYYIEPASYTNPKATKKSFLLYEGDAASAELESHGEHICGVQDTRPDTKSIKDKNGNNTTHNSQMACRGLKIAIASDHTMWTAYGSEQGINNHNIGVLNNVQGDYDGVGSGGFDIELQVIAQYNSQNQASNPYNTTGADAGTLLNEFSSWSTGGGFGSSATPYLQGGRNAQGLGTLWTNKDITFVDNNGQVQSGVVGLAYQPGNYSLLEDFGNVNTNGSGYGLRVLQSHEMGHNLGYGHDSSTSCSGGNCIMWPSVQNTSTWSGASITAINANLNGRSLGGCNASCSNGVQDLGEQGVDCGGVCEPCPCAESDIYRSPLSLAISFDNYAEESSWDIRTAGDQVLYSASYTAAEKNGSVTVPNITLDAANGFKFSFYDAYGDGMCCSYGNGSFTLTDADGQVIYTGGSFANSTSKTFCINNTDLCTNGELDSGELAIDCGGSCIPCIEGCMDNTSHNYNPNAQVDNGTCATCSDGINNGDEQAIDCGGSLCAPCQEGCNDGIQNGDETGIDCGGDSCKPCECTATNINSDTTIDQDKSARALETITSSDKVMSDATLIYAAGTSIILEEGFEISSNSNFEALIEDCEN